MLARLYWRTNGNTANSSITKVKEEPAMIAICVFQKLTGRDETSDLSANSDKPYTYYNPEAFGEGQLALVHANSNFGVVKIVRNLSLEEIDPAKLKLTNVLLGEIKLNLSDVRSHYSNLKLLQERLGSEQVQAEITSLLKKKG